MEVHMRLRDVLLWQPYYIPDSPVTGTPWLEPPFAAPSVPPPAHRAYIYSNTKAAKTAALTASSKDQVRESHARELTGRHLRPEILDEVFQEY
jgi:hypothetical protein